MRDQARKCVSKVSTSTPSMSHRIALKGRGVVMRAIIPAVASHAEPMIAYG